MGDVNRRGNEARAVSGVFETSGTHVEGEVPIDIQTAMDFFKGKSVALSAATEGNAFRRASTMASLAATLGGVEGPAALESPMDRMRRLRGELTEVRNFVEGFLESRNVKEDEPLTTAAAEECQRFFGADHRELLADLNQLESSIEQTANSAAFIAVQDATTGEVKPTMKLPGAQELTASVLEMLHAQMKEDAAAPNKGDTVTFELYTESKLPAAAASGFVPQSHYLDSARLLDIERRLSDLEDALGVQRSFHRMWLPTQSVCEALQVVIGRLSSLHPARLDTLARRVAALSTQVDDLLVRRAKLASREVAHMNDEVNAVGEMHRISVLYDFAENARPAASALPTVLARLKALRALHQESAALVSRLDALEAQQEQLAAVLSSSEESLLKLRDTVAQNAVWAKDIVAQLSR